MLCKLQPGRWSLCSSPFGVSIYPLPNGGTTSPSVLSFSSALVSASLSPKSLLPLPYANESSSHPPTHTHTVIVSLPLFLPKIYHNLDFIYFLICFSSPRRMQVSFIRGLICLGHSRIPIAQHTTQCLADRVHSINLGGLRQYSFFPLRAFVEFLLLLSILILVELLVTFV